MPIVRPLRRSAIVGGRKGGTGAACKGEAVVHPCIRRTTADRWSESFADDRLNVSCGLNRSRGSRCGPTEDVR